MAENKNYRDRIEGMGKRELNALNKEIRKHYAEHGWRKTVGEYKIAPKDLSSIVGDTKSKPKKVKDKPKKKAKSKAKKTAEKTTKKKADKKPAKRGRPKKKPEASTKTKAKKKPVKKKVSKRGKAKRENTVAPTAEDAMVLDYLLRRRKGKDAWRDPETIDQVILDLTTRIRGV